MALLKQEELEPEWLYTLNPLDAAKVARLVARMRKHGWQRRPLLVEEGFFESRHAWTGTHRVEAAIKAGLVTVPCLVLPFAAAQEIVANLPDRAGAQSTLLNCLNKRSNGGGPDDAGRLSALVRLGLDEMAEEVRREMKAKDG